MVDIHHIVVIGMATEDSCQIVVDFAFLATNSKARFSHCKSVVLPRLVAEI